MSFLLNAIKKIDLFPGFQREESKESSQCIDLPPLSRFLAPRILLIPFPSEDLRAYTFEYLESNFPGKYMIWNLSNTSYSREPYILEYLTSTGHGLLEIFDICNSMKSWLDSYSENIAVVHCNDSGALSLQTIATFLTWTTDNYSSTLDAFLKLCQAHKKDPASIVSPSQSRYMGYCDKVMNGEIGASRKIALHRVIMNSMNILPEPGTMMKVLLEVHKGSALVWSLEKNISYHESMLEIMFNVESEVEDDLIIRCICRGDCELEFCAMIHTAFVFENHLRFTYRELDMKGNELPSDFFIDLVFSDNKALESEQNPWTKYQKLATKYSIGEDSNEEEVDKELIEKYKIEDVEENHEDMDEYFKKLEESKE